MKQLACLCLLSFACAVAVAAHAQEVQPMHKEPIASVTTGWTYLWADEGNHYRSNLNGWFLRPAVNLPHGFSIFFDSTNYYGTNAKGSLNSHGFTLGIGKNVFTTRHVKPNIFIESGDIRASSKGITNEAVVATGIGFSIPLGHGISLAITPAEYAFLYPNADWRNDYNAKVGFNFPIGRR